MSGAGGDRQAGGRRKGGLALAWLLNDIRDPISIQGPFKKNIYIIIISSNELVE